MTLELTQTQSDQMAGSRRRPTVDPATRQVYILLTPEEYRAFALDAEEGKLLDAAAAIGAGNAVKRCEELP